MIDEHGARVILMRLGFDIEAGIRTLNMMRPEDAQRRLIEIQEEHRQEGKPLS